MPKKCCLHRVRWLRHYDDFISARGVLPRSQLAGVFFYKSSVVKVLVMCESKTPGFQATVLKIFQFPCRYDQHVCQRGK